MASQAGISTLLQRFAGETSLLQKAAVVFAGSLLLWASAKVQIPFYPVPLTMQTFAVLAIGAALGWRLGLATVLLYLAEGAAGLPVFAGTPEKGIGLAYMMGPTGGYLLGYLPAAALCGWLAQRGWDRSVALTALAMLAGNIMIYLPGLLGLGAIAGWDKPVLAWGLTPFLLGDLLKLSLASAALPLVWRASSARADPHLRHPMRIAPGQKTDRAGATSSAMGGIAQAWRPSLSAP